MSGNEKIDYSQRWVEMLEYTNGLYPSLDKDDRCKTYYYFVRYLRKILKNLDEKEKMKILDLPNAKLWLTHSTIEVRNIEAWYSVLESVLDKYGYYKMPSLAEGAKEKELYWLIYKHKRRIKQTGKTYDCIYSLPMADQWLK